MSIGTQKEQLLALADEMKPMHLRIARAMANGLSQYEAYREAGGRGKDPRARASDLIRTNPNILKYVNLANRLAVESSQDELVATTTAKRKMLWDLAIHTSNSKGNSFNPRAAIAAIAELNKMDGDLATIKTEAKVEACLKDNMSLEERRKRIEELRYKLGYSSEKPAHMISNKKR